MEIRYTIEILTKDIQDIEKLVGNLQNSRDGSAIELDLALSKLRNVYEILTMIKADRLNELFAPEKPEKPAPVMDPDPVPEADPRQEIKPAPEVKQVAEEQSQKEVKQVPEENLEEEVRQPDELKSSPRQATRKEAEILAEKFSAESSINENLAGQRVKLLDSKLTGPPIDNIARNMGINDRFLIIRELFNGDTEKFSFLLTSLETAGDYHKAHGLLESHFSGSMDHGGVEILSGLIKRRYVKQ